MLLHGQNSSLKGSGTGHNDHSQKKGTKAVTGAVPFQKVHFCT